MGGKNEVLKHRDFTEYILPQTISETAFYPKEGKELQRDITYLAHIGIIDRGRGEYDLFCNWESILAPYYLTADKANKVLLQGTKQPFLEEEKLRESFRNFAPTLYKVFTDASFPVKPKRQMRIAGRTLDVMAVRVRAESEEAAMQDSASSLLIDTCLQICKEVSTTTHLAIWRRYLLGVWLHE